MVLMMYYMTMSKVKPERLAIRFAVELDPILNTLAVFFW